MSSNTLTRVYEDACMLADCEEILEKKKLISCQTSVLDFFKSPSGNPSLPPVLLNIGDDDLDDWPTVKREVPLLRLLFSRHIIFYVNLL